MCSKSLSVAADLAKEHQLRHERVILVPGIGDRSELDQVLRPERRHSTGAPDRAEIFNRRSGQEAASHWKSLKRHQTDIWRGIGGRERYGDLCLESQSLRAHHRKYLLGHEHIASACAHLRRKKGQPICREAD